MKKKAPLDDTMTQIDTSMIRESAQQPPKLELDPEIDVGPPIDTIGLNWPRQSLYHGAVHRVKWNQPIDDEASAELDAAIGGTQEEAIAALLSTELIEDTDLRKYFEQFFMGFSLDVLGELDSADGIYRFQQELHRQTFHTVDGGVLFDYVKQEELPASPTNNRFSGIARASGLNQGVLALSPDLMNYDISRPNIQFAGNVVSQDDANTANPTGWMNPALAAASNKPIFNQENVADSARAFTGAQRRNFDNVPRFDKPLPAVTMYPAPRYYETRDPVLILAYERRSTQGLKEGYYHPQGLTIVRTALDIDRLVGTENRTTTITEGRMWMPQEINALFDEVCFVAKEMLALPQNKGVKAFQQFRDGKSTGNEMVQDYGSHLCHQVWRQAWLPIFADVKFKFYPEMEQWELGQLDFNRKGGFGAIEDNSDIQPIEIVQRLPVTRHSADIVTAQLEKLLTEEAELDQEGIGQLTPDEAEGIKSLMQNLSQRDLLTITLSGLDDFINQQLEDFPLRAGLVEIEELSLVDAFGQVQEVNPTGLLRQRSANENAKVSIGLSLQNADDEYGKLMFKPRIPKPARFDFRLLAHDDDSKPATGGTAELLASELVASPVCGYLLPDHIEWAMEVFDNSGLARGQLRVAQRDWTLGGIQKGGLVWETSPGDFSPAGASPDGGNKHLNRILQSLMEIGRVDEMEGDLADAGEGVLSALLRAIDTTSWHADPYGKGGINHPTLYMGRPVAVVRALLRLQVEGGWNQMSEAQRKHAFQVRLGSIEKEVDGLLGYFVNDDYSRLFTVYPIDESLPRPDSDHSIDHDFLSFDTTIDVLPERDIFLTLLIHPQSSLHITSGFLPQKEIMLLREHWEEAMAKIAPTFKVGPVLIDPASIRMPVDDAKPNLTWQWLHRDTPSSILQSEVKVSDDLAGLPNGKMRAFEGWLKLKNTQGEGK